MSFQYDSNLRMSDGLTSQELRDLLVIIGDQHLGVNLLGDPTFVCWPGANESVLQGYWHFDGIGTGTARRATGNYKFNGMCSKMAYGDQTLTMYQEVLSTNTDMTPFKSRYVSAGCWVLGTATGVIRINDGDDQSDSDAHPGDNAWHWLSVTHQISTSATKLRFEYVAASAGNGFCDGATMVFGPVPPPDYLPGMVREDPLNVQIHGNPVSTGLEVLVDHTQPFVVRNVALLVSSTPAGQALIIDVNQWNGSAWQSMYSTRPQVAIAAFDGYKVPEGTYKYSCFNPGGDVADADSPNYKSDGAHMSINVDQAPTSGGKNPNICITTLRWHRPLDQFMEFND